MLLSQDHRPLAALVLPTVRGEDGIVQAALAVVEGLLAEGGAEHAALAGIGVGVPGTVDIETGVVANAVNLDVTELALGELLRSATGVPVFVDNDVNVAGIGAAHHLGCTESIAYLNVGTGLAACLVQGGEVFGGCSGVAGEIGHLPVDPGGLLCPCGQVGCLETMASGAAVARRWPSEAEHPSDDLLSAYLAGDPRGVAVFRTLAEGIAQAVRALVLAYDPASVVVGGGIMRLGAPLLEEVHSIFQDWGRSSLFVASLNLQDRFRTLPAGAEVGATGAALLASAAATYQAP